jgi:hypothetical protein
MAMPRHKIRGIGAPFDINYSSCSNLKPINFDWSLEPGDYEVHIDRGLLIQPDINTSKIKRFGWVCESRFIIPNVYDFLINNHKLLFDDYYNKIFTCDQTLLNLNSNFVYCPNGSNYPWIKKQDWNMYPKSKLCSMFCSPKKMTEGHVYRHQIARLALDLGFDVFGGAHGTPRTVIDPHNPWNTKIDGLKDYMFSIVIENGQYDSYWTEKLTDCFAVGTIPIYLGTKNIPNTFNKEGIIFLELERKFEILNTLTQELYLNKIQAANDNLAALQKMKLADNFLYESLINEITKN